MAELNEWAILAANNNNAPPDGWPENTMQYSEVNNTAREGMAVMARYYQDINGSVHTAGVVNAYTATLNSGHTAYFDGLYCVLHFTITNTGASTIDINGIGPVAIQDRNGNALIAGAIQALGIYELRYDGMQFQLMGTLSGGLSSRMNNAGDPTTPDAMTGGVQLYSADGNLYGDLWYNADEHLRVKNYAQGGRVDLFGVDSGGVERQILGGDPDGNATLYQAGVRTFAASGTGEASIYSAGSTDTETRLIRFLHQDATLRGLVGHNSSDIFYIDNRINGGAVHIRGWDTGGATQNIITGDPDGNSTLYYAGLGRWITVNSGRCILRGDDNVSTSLRNIRFEYLNGVLQAAIGNFGDTSFIMRSYVNSSWAALQSFTSGSALVNLVDGDPDGAASLYFNGQRTAGTLNANAGGLEVRNDLTGAGFERAATAPGDIDSGSFTETTVGMVTNFDVTVNWQRVGNLVTITLDPLFNNNTSNSTTFRLSNLNVPSSIMPSGTTGLAVCALLDNGATVLDGFVTINGAGRIDFYNASTSSTSWTASGVKGFSSSFPNAVVFSYLI